MSAFRIVPATDLGQRRERVRNLPHLARVRLLPCLVCGASGPSEACHVRMGSIKWRKRSSGMQETASDTFTVPMCASCHREGKDAQHKQNEREFWGARGIEIFRICALLALHSGDLETMRKVVSG